MPYISSSRTYRFINEKRNPPTTNDQLSFLKIKPGPILDTYKSNSWTYFWRRRVYNKWEAMINLTVPLGCSFVLNLLVLEVHGDNCVFLYWMTDRENLPKALSKQSIELCALVAGAHITERYILLTNTYEQLECTVDVPLTFWMPLWNHVFDEG